MNCDNVLKFIFKIVNIVITFFLISISIVFLRRIIFLNDIEVINYISKCGVFSAIIFVLLQIFQVIFPVIPGGVSCWVGVIIFGPFKGFLYNYIGLSIGSIIVFWLSKKYGMVLIRKFFSNKILKKYEKYLNDKNYYKLFLFSILLPGMPDDLMCYLSGLTSITYKRFISIILTCKPLTLLIYSISWHYFPDFANLFT